MLAAVLAVQILNLAMFGASLPAGQAEAKPGMKCAQSTFSIATSNLGRPLNDHSTDVVNAWQVLSNANPAGWIAKTRNGNYFYMNPLAFDDVQQIDDSNANQLRPNKRLSFVGCFKADYTGD